MIWVSRSLNILNNVLYRNRKTVSYKQYYSYIVHIFIPETLSFLNFVLKGWFSVIHYSTYDWLVSCI